MTIDQPIGVQSVNGAVDTPLFSGYWMPGATNGSAAIRCAYLTNGATLAGFTLRGGATQRAGTSADLGGGGILCEPGNALVSNCVVSGNASYYGGGGVYRGTF